MGKMGKTAIIAIIIIVLAAVLVPWLLKKSPDLQVLDGDGMIYRWVDYELYGTWVEASETSGGDRAKLVVDSSTMKLVASDGRETVMKYRIPDYVELEGTPEGEVHLELEWNGEFESVIFHSEPWETGSPRLSVLSGTVFEYDGRGEIVVAEFVREDDLWRVPDRFESTVAKSHNSWDGVPSMMMEADITPAD